MFRLKHITLLASGVHPVFSSRVAAVKYRPVLLIVYLFLVHRDHGLCYLHLKIEFRYALGASVVWHLSLRLMNSFNKTEAAIFPCYASWGLARFSVPLHLINNWNKKATVCLHMQVMLPGVIANRLNYSLQHTIHFIPGECLMCVRCISYHDPRCFDGEMPPKPCSINVTRCVKYEAKVNNSKYGNIWDCYISVDMPIILLTSVY